MAKKQGLVMLFMAVMGLLVGPAYMTIAFLTLPLGVGLLMLMHDDWILNLYPLMFAGQMQGGEPNFYLNNEISIPLTVLEWLLISWVFSLIVRDFKPRELVLGAVAMLLAVGALTSHILHIANIALVSNRWHM